ncbi:TonB-dependent siderophore receptor [Komagataeibacter oboediens]|uniref:TonB-dependent siderophore receptor n=1 Tax=Komagataeibacter oboediens TaxID=65958 RepID=UPI0023DBDFA8|nr:TonB-dependent siderophore receptor [Komagataeibacter oboediens]WEQ53680.1 TonB-dependent siderophore receptor [Komagataeibacter oboediens]
MSVGADRKIIAAILMTSSALASVAGASGAFAQTVVSSAMTADQSKSFSIPAGSLAKTLTSFGAQSGKQVSVETSVIQGLSSPGVAGLMTARQALTQLLAGTGLTYRLSGNVVTLVQASANITLGPVRVGGTFNAHAAAIGPGNGYVATYTDAGTKTDTSIIEIPNSVYVITKQQILDQQAQNVLETLRYMPGVFAGSAGTAGNGAATGTTGAGTTSSVMMRGFQATQYVDGIVSRSNSAGETAFVERVEALNGPASVLYGQAGPGGLIATRLKQPTDTPIRNVTVGFGNWGRYEATFDVADKVTKSGNLKYRIAGIGVTQGEQTQYLHYKRVGVLPSLKWDIDNKTSLTVLGEYMYTPDAGLDLGYPGIGTLIPGKNGYIPRSRYLGDPSARGNTETEADFEYQFSHKFNKNWEFQQTFRYENSKQNFNTLYIRGGLQSDGETLTRSAWNGYDASKTIGLDSRVVGHVDAGIVKQIFVAGVDFRKVETIQNLSYDVLMPSINIWDPIYNVSYPNYSFNGDGIKTVSNVTQNQFQKGVYFQDQLKVGHLSVLLGGRQDWYDRMGTSYQGSDIYGKITPVHLTSTQSPSSSKFTWRAGFTYNFDFGLTPYFSYSTSFVPQVGAINYQGSELKPLTGKQFEAGLKYLVPDTDVLLTASAYHIKENHYQTTDTEHLGYEADAGTVVSKGVEFSAHANVTHDLRMTASYSFNDTRVTKSNNMVDKYSMAGASLGEVSQQGMYIGSLPRNMMSVFADYTLPRKIFRGFGINFGARYVGWTYADNAQSYKVPPYILFDAGAHFDFENVSLSLKGLRAQLAMSNLANTRYVTSCGSSSYGGMCYYGQGRRVYGNISYSW